MRTRLYFDGFYQSDACMKCRRNFLRKIFAALAAALVTLVLLTACSSGSLHDETGFVSTDSTAPSSPPSQMLTGVTTAEETGFLTEESTLELSTTAPSETVPETETQTVTPTEMPTPTPSVTPSETSAETPDDHPTEGLFAIYDLSKTENDKVSMYIYADKDETDRYSVIFGGRGEMREIDMNDRPWKLYDQKIKYAVIEGGVTNIPPRLLSSEAALERVVVEPGVQSIGMDAFAYCSRLTELYLPETLTQIGQGIVYGSGVQKVYLGFTTFSSFFKLATKENFNFMASGGQETALDNAVYFYAFHYGDQPDEIDRSQISEIDSQNSGYNEILRIKTTQDLLFSPNIHIFTDYMRNADSAYKVEDYFARLVISVVDGAGSRIYTYPTLTLPLHTSKGAWYDIYLQGKIGDDTIDTGFCPQPDRIYNIYMEILDPSGKTALFQGEYNGIKVPSSIEGSKFFKTMIIPGEEDLLYTVEYIVRGDGGKIEGQSRFSLPFGASIPDVRVKADEGYAFLQWSDGQTDALRTGDTVKGNKRIYADFIRISSLIAVPDVYITTESGDPIMSKTYVPGSISISGGDDSYLLDASSMQIRGRGNSSWSGATQGYDSKNSYKLKLDQKEGLFGMPAAKKWVLNSNKFDAPGLRTWSMWRLADLMGSISYTPRSQFVNLYVNGIYRGMYLLTEQIEVKKTRVKAEDGEEPDEKGFLIELDFRGRGEAGAVEDLTYFMLDSYAHEGAEPNVAFVIKNDEPTVESTALIKAFVSKCSDALLSGDRALIEQYVDLPSLIDMYIIEEFSLDVDSGSASFYIQRTNGGKLLFTAPWDFDFGFGTYGPAVGTTGFYNNGRGCVWFSRLFAEEWFRNAVYARMKELDETVMPRFYELITEKGEELAFAGNRNAEFWNMYGNQIHPYVSSGSTSGIYTYKGYVDFMIDWMQSCWSWMLENIAV